MLWIWLGIVLICIGLEIIVRKILFIPFGVGAIFALCLELINIDIIYQVIAFFSASFVFLFVRLILLKNISLGSHIIPLEETIGLRCTVIEEVDNFRGCGMVRVGNQMWSARSAFDEDVFKIGETLSVVAIEGPKLICKKL